MCWKVKRVRIGELADRAGLTATAVRYYESVGVVDSPPRTPAGYRDYDEAYLGRLEFVRAAQAVGLTLGEIRGVVALRDRGETPCAHVRELLSARAEEVESRISELRLLREELLRLVARAERLDPAACEEGRVCHLIGPASTG